MAPECEWLLPQAQPTLAHDEVHVWRASLRRPLPVLERLAGTLSPDERQRATRFGHAHDRNDFLAGRGLVRRILGHYMRVEPAHVRFAYGPQGKPALEATSPAGGLSYY